MPKNIVKFIHILVSIACDKSCLKYTDYGGA